MRDAMFRARIDQVAEPRQALGHTIGHWACKEFARDAERSLRLQRRTARRGVPYDPRLCLAQEGRAPIANCVLAHPECLADLGAGPARKLQRDRPVGLRPVRGKT
jgi:hypothetical protein